MWITSRSVRTERVRDRERERESDNISAVMKVDGYENENGRQTFWNEILKRRKEGKVIRPTEKQQFQPKTFKTLLCKSFVFIIFFSAAGEMTSHSTSVFFINN